MDIAKQTNPNYLGTLLKLLEEKELCGTRRLKEKRENCVRSKMRGCFDLRDDWVKDLRDKNLLLVDKVNSEDNLADFFTKCFSKGKFNGLKRRIMK